MNKLRELLTATGWTPSPGVFRLETGDWIYSWLTEPAGTAERYLVRRPQGTPPEADNLEMFMIRTEERSLEIAAQLNRGEHPPSPHLNRVNGKKIGYL